MAVDRYTKAVLTVIAACLVWLVFDGPSPVTSVSAQGNGNRVVLAGWVDQDGSVVSFPRVPRDYDYSRLPPYPSRPRTAWPMPITEAVK